jgi:hypothetical protein
MVADPERISDDGEPRIDCAAGREKTSIYHVKIVEFVGLAVHV